MNVRQTLWILSAALSAAGVTMAQAPQASRANSALRFEVASVRINAKAEGPSKISGPTPGRLVISNTPLRFIVLYAYGLLDHQLIGAPEWTWSSSIDIEATYPAGVNPTDQDTRMMVRNLLQERFGFAAHQERREMPVYALTLARKNGRLGMQIRRSEVDCEKWMAEKRPTADAGGPSAVSPSKRRPACGMMATRRFLAGGTRTIQQLAVTLQSMVGRPVIDRTGLTGAYDIDLQWTPEESNSDPPQSDTPSIFTALQEQLGLKLTPQKAPVQVLVIDKVTRPTAN